MNSQTHSDKLKPKNLDHNEARIHRYGEFSPDDSIIHASKMILQNQMEFIHKMTPVAIEGRDKEGVHKMRVGYRRIRTCLRLIKPYVKKKKYKFFQHNAKVIGQVLGKIRDLDVLFENINDISSQTNLDDNVSSLSFRELDFANTYNEHKNLFLEYISSPEYTHFHKALEEFSDNEKAGLRKKICKSKKRFTIKEHLPDNLFKLYSKMELYGSKFQSPQPYHSYHSFRVETKKFRYTLEFFSSTYEYLPYSTLVDELILLQDQLGFLNDCVVANEIITRQAKKSLLSEMPGEAKWINLYIKIRNSEKNRIIEQMPEIWESFQLVQPHLLLSQSLSPLVN